MIKGVDSWNLFPNPLKMFHSSCEFLHLSADIGVDK